MIAKKYTAPLFISLLVCTPLCLSKPKKKKTHTTAEQTKEPKKSFSFFTTKNVKDMSFEELAARKDSYLNGKNYEVALKYIDQMVTIAPDSAKRSTCEFERAEILRLGGELSKAIEAYGDFAETYPSDNQTEYATYQQVSCSFNLMLDAERDQTQTKKTVELANKFLDRKLFKSHRAEVQQIKTACLERLLESEIKIFKHHLNMNDLLAAQQRLKCIKEEFVETIPTLEFQAYNLDIELAQASQDTQKIIELTAIMKEKYPTGSLLLAENNTPKKNASDRF